MNPKFLEIRDRGTCIPVKNRFLVANLVALVLAGAVIIESPSDIWDGFCAAICPWSPLCVPPICMPSPGDNSAD